MRNRYLIFSNTAYFFKMNVLKRSGNRLLLVFALLFSFNTFSQSNHTVNFTNSSSDFNALEKISAASGSTDYYVTFDANNLYIGAFRTAGNFVASDNLAIYIDTDPNAVATSGNGTTTGKSYNGVTATLPFKADFNVYAEESVQQANNYSAGWVAASGITYSTSANTREVKIPFSSMANPKALNITLWIGNSGAIYSNAPGGNIASSATPAIINYFGTFGIMNGTQGNVNPVNVISSPATGYLSASGAVAAGTYANIDVTGNATISSLTLAPGGIINVNSGKSLTSSGTINNTSIVNNTKSTQINVSGSYTLTGRANCSYFNVNNGATYTHNSAGSVTNGIASDWPGIDSRTYGATSYVDIKQWATNSGTAVVGIPAPTSGGWGNVTFDIAQSFPSVWNQKGAFNNVAGNLILNNIGTNNKSMYYLTFNPTIGDSTINIGGNFEMHMPDKNGIFLSLAAAATTTETMNVHGDFISTGGHLKFGYQQAKIVVNLWGNYRQTGGEIKAYGWGGTTINLYGVNKYIYGAYVAFGGANFNSMDITFVIKKGADIYLNGNLPLSGSNLGDASNAVFIVDGTLNCYNYQLQGFGSVTFTLSPGGTIKSGNSNGIAAQGTTSGNIVTPNRNFSTQANYVYTGTGNQVTGTGLPATVNSLTINNTGTSNKTVSLTNNVNITSFHEIDNGIFSLGSKNVTLHSGSDTTCTFNKLGTGASITYGTGRYIVERYINTGTGTGQHGKSWQLLSTPADGGTVKNTWQENGSTSSGYGTWITDPSGTANGFDAYSAAPSMKIYNASTDAYDGITSTNNFIANSKGYFLFVRGDRTATTTNAIPTPTTLRTTGKLFTGNQPSLTVPANSFQSIGNPYASAVDFPTLYSKSSGIDNSFYVWDPSIAGVNGAGGFQTISAATGFIATPGASTIYNSTTNYNSIQSGQAFFVHNSGASSMSVNFTEDCKNAGSLLVNGAISVEDEKQLFFSYLYTSKGNMTDGNAVSFSNAFSKNVDADDAIKPANAGENFGLQRNNEILSVEARPPVTQQDSIFYDMHNLKQQDYKLIFVPGNMNRELKAFLTDLFLKTNTPVSLTDSTVVNFSVTPDPLSYVANRFMIVLKLASESLLPVTFVSLNAYSRNDDVIIKWEVENESNINKYEVEHSADGIHFSSIGSIAANNIAQSDYQYTDNAPVAGTNYYRIKSLDKDGNIKYSGIVKAFTGNIQHSISVYPNPLEGKNIHLQLTEKPAGKYYVRILNLSGQVMLSQEINYAGGTGTQTVRLSNNMSGGVYQLEITEPGGEKDIITMRK